jgi:hypothetical protein
MEKSNKKLPNKPEELNLVYLLRILLNYKLPIFLLLLSTAIISYIYASNRVDNPVNYRSSAIIKVGWYENQHGYEVLTNPLKSTIRYIEESISKENFEISILPVKSFFIEIITSSEDKQLAINEINNVLNIVKEEHEKAVSTLKYNALINHNQMILNRNLQLLSITDTPIKTNREDQKKLFNDALVYSDILLSLDLDQINWQLSDIYNEPLMYEEITTIENPTKLINKYLIILISLVSVLFVTCYSIIIFKLVFSKDRTSINESELN